MYHHDYYFLPTQILKHYMQFGSAPLPLGNSRSALGVKMILSTNVPRDRFNTLHSICGFLCPDDGRMMNGVDRNRYAMMPRGRKYTLKHCWYVELFLNLECFSQVIHCAYCRFLDYVFIRVCTYFIYSLLKVLNNWDLERDFIIHYLSNMYEHFIIISYVHVFR